MIPGRITNDQLLDAFVSQGLATEEQLKNLLDAQRKNFVHEQSLLAGKALLVDPNRREMIVLEFPEEKEFKRIALSKHASSKLVYNPAEWQRWGSHLVVLNPEDGTRVAHYDWQTASLYGLIFCDKRMFLYNEMPLKQDYLAMSSHASFGAVYTGSIPSAPFDLALSPSQRWLCIADRAAGTVTVYDTWNFESNGTAMVCEPGRTHAINMAIDEPNERIFITDNQSTGLQVLNFRTMEINRLRFNQGQLGNLVLAPDGLHLYLLTLSPIEELLYLNTETLAVDQVIKLKGEFFKNNTPDPTDLMVLSPDGKMLMVMTYLDEPAAFTPVISVIDTAQNKTIRRYAFKDGVKPFQLAFASPNPIKPHTKSLEDLIMAAGICDAKTLLDIKQRLRDGTLGERSVLAPVIETPLPVPEAIVEAEPEKPAIQIEIKEPENKDKVLNDQPIQSNHIDLPPEAIDEIIEILVGTFQKQVNEDISGYEEVMHRLRDVAESARQELEEFDSTIVQIDDLFEGRSLQTAILREAILIMLDLKASAKADSLRSVPSHCPNCKAALLGNWDCSACGFEVESPDRAAKRRIASADAIANLPLGHLVMPDPQGLRLLQLNPYKYVVWNLDPDQLTCDYPVDALWLKNQNVLVVDRDGNRVIELGNRGQIEWAFNTGLSHKHVLKEPVKVTYYTPVETPPEQANEQMHLLIVDQGQHRVIEVDREHQVLREFGVQGQSGSDGKSLNSPSDVQYTHDHTYLITDTGNNRVLEFEKNGSLKKVIGAAFGLKKPTAAQRLFNDHTLILDSGNDRLLELDDQGEIFHETQYYTRAINEKYRVVSPLKMIRLINKNIMIIDEDKLIQVRLKDNKLLWYSMTEDLAFQPKVAEPEIVVDENGVSHKVYNLIDHGHIRPVRLSQKINFKRMHKLIEARLRNESVEDEELDGKTKDAANRLRALIEDRKLEQKRSLQQELSLDTFQPSEIFEKPDTDLVGIRIYCIDRNHNGFIRINRKGEVKWHYGFEMGQKMQKPHYYSETKRTILIADAGNNRILEISKADKEVIAEFKGPDQNPLSGPRSALRLSMGRTLICDPRKKRIIELGSAGEVLWEFSKVGQISSPQYAEELENGNILFTDTMMNSVRELNRNGDLVWSFGTRLKGNGPGQLFAPEYATRLINGSTLIADTRNNRVLEVTYEGREVWIFSGDPRNRRRLMNPVRCERLENGNTLVTYNNHREMVEVTPAFETVWYFKMGNDVFQTPVEADSKKGQQVVEKLSTYYNPIEKRMFQSATKSNMSCLEVHLTMMPNVQMKSVRASLIMMRLEKFGTVVKTFPSPEEILADKFGKQLIIALILDPEASTDFLREDILNIAELEEISLEAIFKDESKVLVAENDSALEDALSTVDEISAETEPETELAS